MNKNEVLFDVNLTVDNSLKAISAIMDKKNRQAINITPWADYSYKPSVSFAMSYDDNRLVIKFYVIEKNTKAVYWKTNEPVYKDSCVEFFISFNERKTYYNFEFNCVGNCLVGYGPDKQNRELLSENYLNKMQLLSTIERSILPAGEYAWELTVAILFETFCFDKIKSLKGMRCFGNFYKCGDDLASPHFVSWNNIKSEHPNFHLPEYFGEINFL
ncbi:carbohydrate-binding family 9-like protein [Chitinophagaceae bacterium LWZ2-11]